MPSFHDKLKAFKIREVDHAEKSYYFIKKSSTPLRKVLLYVTLIEMFFFCMHRRRAAYTLNALFVEHTKWV